MSTTEALGSAVKGIFPKVGGGGGLSSILPYIVALGIIGIIAYFGIRYMKWNRYFNTPIINFSERAGNLKIIRETGGYVPDRKKKNVWNFWIKEHKKPAPNPPYKSLYPTTKGNIALFYEKSPSERYPAIIDLEQPVEYVDTPMLDKDGNKIYEEDGKTVKTQKVAKMKVRIIEHDIQLWQQNMDGIIDAEFKAKNDLKAMLPMIMWGIFVFGTIIGLYILAKKFDVLASVAKALSDAATTLKQSGVQLPSNAPS